MYTKLSLLVGALMAVNASALHYFNCSSADSSVQIVEKEIWGANPVGCYYQGEGLEDGEVVLDSKSLKIVEGQRGQPGGNWEAQYTVKAKVTAKDLKPVSALLLCQEKSDSRLDFAAPPAPPCKVTFSK
ncbi:hypothetical protein K2X33_06805 [bacterium]|nr:hypothetical protein [bacterium]